MKETTGRTKEKLLSVENLKTYFPVRGGFFGRTADYVRAVDGVSFDILQGQVFGLVGESGCGKTTVAKSIIRLVSVNAGKVLFDGVDIIQVESAVLKAVRGKIGFVYQDPYSSLNPRMTVRGIIGEPLIVHRKIADRQLDERVASMLEKVGLTADCLNQYPHQFSGGQCQRIAIARALVNGPKLVICDEPVSALDVSVQGQILNMLKDLRDELGVGFLFITHDLTVAEFFCDIIAVMHRGKIVEQRPVKI